MKRSAYHLVLCAGLCAFLSLPAQAQQNQRYAIYSANSNDPVPSTTSGTTKSAADNFVMSGSQALHGGVPASSGASNYNCGIAPRASATEMLGQFKSASMGAAGAVYGACFGVPIRMTKYIFSESHRMNQTLHDDFTDEPDIQATILARSMGIPYGIASGTILGIIHGVGDGVSKGYKKPFSKDSIGLGNQDPAAALSTKSPATSQLPNRSTLGTRP